VTGTLRARSHSIRSLAFSGLLVAGLLAAGAPSALAGGEGNLTVTLTGNGTGTVVGPGGHINCTRDAGITSGQCDWLKYSTAQYPNSDLTVTAAVGSAYCDNNACYAEAATTIIHLGSGAGVLGLLRAPKPIPHRHQGRGRLRQHHEHGWEGQLPWELPVGTGRLHVWRRGDAACSRGRGLRLRSLDGHLRGDGVDVRDHHDQSLQRGCDDGRVQAQGRGDAGTDPHGCAGPHGGAGAHCRPGSNAAQFANASRRDGGRSRPWHVRGARPVRRWSRPDIERGRLPRPWRGRNAGPGDTCLDTRDRSTPAGSRSCCCWSSCSASRWAGRSPSWRCAAVLRLPRRRLTGSAAWPAVNSSRRHRCRSRTFA
jgi:hypothetical protein